MANLQIRNISEALHQQLRDTATEQRTTISDIVLAAIERELALKQWQRKFDQRASSHLGVSAAILLEEARAERDGLD